MLDILNSYLCRLLPSRPLNVDDYAGQRVRQVAWSVLSNLAVQPLSILVTLVSVPLALTYLGQERYAIWLAMNSLLAWFGLLNFGAPQGLQNALAEAYGRDDKESAHQYISTTFALMCGLALLLIAVFAVLLIRLDWHQVFNVSEQVATAEIQAAMGLAMFAFAFNFPVGIVNTIYGAYQKAYLSSAWTAAGAVLGLIGLVVAINTPFGLPGLVVAGFLVSLITTAFNLIVLFRFQFPFLRPRLSAIRWRAIRRIWKTSVSIFIIQIAVLTISQSANLILIRLVGPAVVPEYALTFMAYNMLRSLFILVAMPLGPAFMEAVSRGDIAWAERMQQRLRWLTLSATAVGLCIMLPFGKYAIGWWTHGEIYPEWGVIAILGVHFVLWAQSGIEAMFINSLDRAHTLVAPAVMEGLILVAIALWLVPTYGTLGMAIATLTGLVFTNGWYCPYQARQTMHVLKASHKPTVST